MPNDCRPAASCRARLPLVLVILGFAGPASAVDSQVVAPPPIFETEVALVAAPVFVTDRSGRAVPGLAAHDFEVYDGGTRVPIVAFQAVDVDAPAAAAGLAAHGVPAAVQAAAARQFVLLFDLQFSPPAGVSRARTAAARFVRESLAPGDLVAVAAFRPTGLRLAGPPPAKRRSPSPVGSPDPPPSRRRIHGSASNKME